MSHQQILAKTLNIRTLTMVKKYLHWIPRWYVTQTATRCQIGPSSKLHRRCVEVTPDRNTIVGRFFTGPISDLPKEKMTWFDFDVYSSWKSHEDYNGGETRLSLKLRLIIECLIRYPSGYIKIKKNISKNMAHTEYTTERWRSSPDDCVEKRGEVTP